MKTMTLREILGPMHAHLDAGDRASIQGEIDPLRRDLAVLADECRGSYDAAPHGSAARIVDRKTAVAATLGSLAFTRFAKDAEWLRRSICTPTDAEALGLTMLIYSALIREQADAS